MARRAYARRYSRAVFEIALETKELDRWQSDLKKMVGVVEDAAFMVLLESPRLHFEDKARLLSEWLEGINPLALNLVLLLVARGRLGIIGDIADEYQRLLDSYRGIEQAEVTTAVPLDDADKVKIAEHLGTIVGKKVVLKCEVDPSLIGGFVARIADKLLDGSTRSKLVALRKELVSAGR
ncbi:MAG: ATP synthase F1 subunit delta [Dehalococcoidales bacterium]